MRGRHRHGRRCTAAAALAAVLLITACSTQDTGASAVAAASGGDDADGTAAEDGDRCADTELEFANLETDVGGTARSAAAISHGSSGLYTAHAADFDIGADDLTSWRPEVPEDHNVITIQLFRTAISEDEDEPLEEGASLAWTTEPGQLTFTVRHFTTDEEWSNVHLVGDAIDENGGDVTVTRIGDEFCFEIDYRDPEKQVSGTVAAPVVGEQ